MPPAAAAPDGPPLRVPARAPAAPAADGSAGEGGRKRPAPLRITRPTKQRDEVKLLGKDEVAELARQHRDADVTDAVPAEIDAERDAVHFPSAQAQAAQDAYFEAHPDKRPPLGDGSATPSDAEVGAAAAAGGRGRSGHLEAPLSGRQDTSGSGSPHSDGRSPRVAAGADGAGQLNVAAAARRPEPVRTARVHSRDLVMRERLGQGRFGDVHRVVHRETHVCYALKVVRMASSDGVRTRDVIRNELERLKHSNSSYTVHTYEAYYSRTAGTVSFLLELMDFGSVEDCFAELKRKQLRIGEADLAHIARQSLEALHELRLHRVVHKDVKPENILIGWRGRVKLGDFGISSFTNCNSEALSGSGSFRWMAPERITSQVFSYNSDVYSLGLVIAYLALGKYPLPIDSCRDLIFAVDHIEKVDLAGLQGSAELREFILCATLKRKEGRPDAERLRTHAWLRTQRAPDPEEDADCLSFLHLLDRYDQVAQRHRARRDIVTPMQHPAQPQYSPLHAIGRTPGSMASVETIGTPGFGARSQQGTSPLPSFVDPAAAAPPLPPPQRRSEGPAEPAGAAGAVDELVTPLTPGSALGVRDSSTSPAPSGTAVEWKSPAV